MLMKNDLLSRSYSIARSRLTVFVLLSLFAASNGLAQVANQVSDRTKQQLAVLFQEKAARTPTQRKINTQLIFAAKQRRTGFITRDVPKLLATLNLERDGRVKVDIDAVVTDGLLASIRAAGGEVINYFPDDQAIRAVLPLESVESLAARDEVRFIRPAVIGEPNTGSVNSQGDIAHRANQARTTYGASGAGIKVGVLSDSIDDGAGALAAAKASGDIDGSKLTVISGQAGTGEGEGLAMLEIVHDLAPGALLYFATANPSPAAMAQNIRALAAAGCRVIIDDYNYPDEPPFQDGVISKAVNDVSAAGVLFFSCARNSGNKNDGTSSTWEGDFADGGDASSVDNHTGSRFLAFSPGVITNTVNYVDHGQANLFWSDPLGHSSNDYDLYVVDTNGFVVRASADTQNGTQDAYESVDTLNVGERLVVVKYSGGNRFIHLDAGRCHLSATTAGCVRGHNASGAANAFSVAAVSANNQSSPFTGGTTNPIETFSSDGPRRVFFTVTGSPYTPGNLSSTGGLVLQKPDMTAADGVSTTLPGNSGLNPFYGTSAAAPHAGAIAAQLLSYRPNATGAQIRAALKASCLDIEAPGFDRDSGSGIVMALAAAQALSSSGGIKADFNGDGKSDIIWQNAAGGRSVWLMNGTSLLSKVSLGTITPSSSIVGSGDFNGDGKADILWQNASGGRFIWLMNGTRLLQNVSLGTVSTSSSIVGSGDFNGDGKSDILWQNTSGGRFVWLMNGTKLIKNVSLGTVSPVWSIVGSGDFNGDGKSDILWQSSSGARSIWLMNGTSLMSKVSLGTVSPSWDIVGSGDFNGDGKSDILWQNAAGGRSVWLMNGTSLMSKVSLGTVSTSWDIRNY